MVYVFVNYLLKITQSYCIFPYSAVWSEKYTRMGVSE